MTTNGTAQWRNWMVLAALAAALPALADTRFGIRRMTRNDVPAGKGQCDIRLQVDNEVDVAVRGDSVSIRTISGRDARDDGSECNAPFPDRDLRDFSFEVKDSRGEIRLVEEPSRRNGFTAVVHIRDSASGEGRYHFRLSWSLTGAADGDYFHGNGAPRENEAPRREPDRMPGNDPRGGMSWNNAIHFSGQGRGESSVNGMGSRRLSDVSVDVDRGGRIVVLFRTPMGQPLSFAGDVIGRDGDTLKADVTSDDRRVPLRGAMFVSVDERQNVRRITLEATNGRDRMRLNWERR